MVKSRFLEFVQDYILRMFTGSEVVGEEESSPRDNIIAQGDSGSIKVKFDRTDNYRIIIKRAQPFKSLEINLIKSIIEESHLVGATEGDARDALVPLLGDREQLCTAEVLAEQGAK